MKKILKEILAVMKKMHQTMQTNHESMISIKPISSVNLNKMAELGRKLSKEW